MLLAFLPVHLRALGFGGHALGGLMATIPLSTLLLVAPFGIISDRYSPRRLIYAGVVLSGAFAGGLGVFSGTVALTAVFFVGGVGFTCFHIPINSLYFKLLGDKQRGVRIATIFAGTVLGYGFGPLFGGLVLSNFSMRALFVVALGGFVLLGFLALWLPDAKPIKFSIATYRDDLRRPAVLFLVVSTFIVASHAGVERTSLTLLITEVVHLSVSKVGFVYACVGVWIAGIGLLAGHAFDKTRRVVIVLSIGLAWSGIFQAATPFAGSFVALLGVRLLHTMGDAFFFILNPILMSLIFPNVRIGGHFGFILTITMFSTSLFAYLAGAVSQPWGHSVAFILNGAMMVVTAGAFIALRKPIRSDLAVSRVT
jgi:MFS family permease